MAARSKDWFCGYSRAGIVGSNPFGGMDVCCKVEVSALGCSLARRSPTDCGCLSVAEGNKNRVNVQGSG